MSSARRHHGHRTPARRMLVAAGSGALVVGFIAVGTTPASAWGSPEAATAMSPGVDASLQPYLLDAFGRTSTGGWGADAQAGTWTHAGSAAAFTVGGGYGTMTMPSTGGNYTSLLATAPTTDTEVQARVGLASKPAGGTSDLYVVGRAIDTTSGYRVKLRVAADGTTVASILRVDGTAAKTVATSTAPLSLTPGKDLQVRFQVTGTGTTALRAKVWAVGTAEPADWTLSTTDTTAALQRDGGVAFTTYTPALAGQTVARYSDLWAGPSAAPRVLDRQVPEPGTVMPDATNTGVPVGTKLTVHNGDLVITTPGTVIDSLDIRGFVKVKAKDVTIKNSVVRGVPTTRAQGLVTAESGSLTIVDSELFNATPSWYVDGLRGSNITAKRLNIHDVIDTMHVYGDNVTLESSWLHDTLHYADDPSHTDGTHDDNIQVVKGTNMTFVGNRIEGAYNAAMMFTQGSGIVSNVTVDKNFFGGGTCTINIAESGKGAIAGLSFTNNTFAMDSRKNCAVISPATTTAKTTYVNNLHTDGNPVVVKRG
ncbi:right-handed parallel beta-helix repeat-containing protein [Cellulomonas sp. URHB0016]